MVKVWFTLLIVIAGLLSSFSCEDIKQPASQAMQPEAALPDSTERVLAAINGAEKAKKIDSIFWQMHKKKRFNGTVLIAQHGVVVYKNAFGYANYQTKDTLQTNSLFELASVSKQFTAVAIMMLYERGKLRYEDSVQRFFPAFPYKGITIRQLLTHRSGLPNYAYFCEKYCTDRKTHISNMDVIRMMTENKPNMYYRPGKRFNYSNTGYCVLEAIVEKVSGLPFPTFMDLHIFRRLNMRDTRIGNESLVAKLPNKTVGYTGSGRRAQEDYLCGVFGDKGVYSTVEDLFKWDQALYGQQLLKQTTLAEAFTPAHDDIKGPFNYGYGWRTHFDAEGNKSVFHRGWWRGYNTLFMRLLKDKSTIIILSNRVNWSFNNIQPILDILYGKGTEQMKESDVPLEASAG